MVTAFVLPDKIDTAIQTWQQEVLPDVQRQKGWLGVRFLVDRSASKLVSIGLWESEADYQATVAWNAAQVAKFASYFAAPPEIGGYEVVIDLTR
jgi:heme-degrading monooxygenase HmoA